MGVRRVGRTLDYHTTHNTVVGSAQSEGLGQTTCKLQKEAGYTVELIGASSEL